MPFPSLPNETPQLWLSLSKYIFNLVSHSMSDAGLPGPKKFKTKFGHKLFQEGQFLKNEKRPNFLEKFVEIIRFKVRIS